MKIEREKQIGFKVTNEEHEQIQKLARKKGMTISSYLRLLVMREVEKGEEK